jgi:hypothetical protein
MPTIIEREWLLPQVTTDQHPINAVIVREGEELVDRHLLLDWIV